ncbi:MAG TPA: glutamate synthase subunit alpha, partial [Ktedonobacteraceae bacterium]|nr:glutamate synthase subunit alpha [Ktedonobacteraceae bacterium]
MHTMQTHDTSDPLYPLYDARWEHDACGTGFLAQVSGEPSHELVETALTALARLTHRGAQDADAETSDGAGILTQIPRVLFAEELQAQHIIITDPGDLAVGMLFLPSRERSPHAHTESRRIIEQTLTNVGLVFLTWRNPPIDYTVLGSRARETAPDIAQIVISRPAHLARDQYERSLYHARRLIERRLREAQIRDCYIVSL